jgi:hypothetical protein
MVLKPRKDLEKSWNFGRVTEWQPWTAESKVLYETTTVRVSPANSLLLSCSVERVSIELRVQFSLWNPPIPAACKRLLAGC